MEGWLGPASLRPVPPPHPPPPRSTSWPWVLRRLQHWGRLRGQVPGALLWRAGVIRGLSPLSCVTDLLARGGRFVSAGIC